MSNHYCWEAWRKQYLLGEVKDKAEQKLIDKFKKEFIEQGYLPGTALWKAVSKVKGWGV